MTIIAKTPDELEQVVAGAAAAAPGAAAATDEERATWLEAVADKLDAHVTELVALADEETHLGEVRLTGEVARTTGQLRLFAAVVREGSYLEAIIDHANPNATPPQPDLRRVLRPVGPVAVYGASNFPFAFSVAGGDTASALAVGCPVVTKFHSGHLQLAARTTELVVEALREAGAPDGIFSGVEGRELGNLLVKHPVIKAAGFTGSLQGGRALFDLASARPEPIPFFGELGSVNPVVITEAAVAERAQELAEGLAGSFTLGVGQFCTKPGVIFVPAGQGFAEALKTAVGERDALPMLTSRIAEAYVAGVAELAADPDVELISSGTAGADGTGAPAILATDAATVVARPEALLNEVFGPATLVVHYRSTDELVAGLSAMEPSLTATLHAADGEDVSAVLALLSDRAGRVLFGGWPTGVAVTWAQHHGGPWPSTTSSHTSVGTTAARRFQRPIAFQNLPDALLPASLQEANPLGIPRRVDGVLQVG